MTGLEDSILRMAALVVALGLIGAAVWKVGRFARRAMHAVNRVDQAIETLSSIAAEFQPNHGSSLKDVVDRIESTADDAAAGVESTREEVRQLRDMVTELVVLPPGLDVPDAD